MGKLKIKSLTKAVYTVLLLIFSNKTPEKLFSE